jgi:hypothetical protein
MFEDGWVNVCWDNLELFKDFLKTKKGGVVGAGWDFVSF